MRLHVVNDPRSDEGAGHTGCCSGAGDSGCCESEKPAVAASNRQDTSVADASPRNRSVTAGRLPQWLRRAPGSAGETAEIKRLLRKSSLNTVCEEAKCPNISECFSRGTATFMILGDICTRGCRFCAVTTGRPLMPESAFASEGERLAEAAEQLGLRHVVVTSVARDDLADGGASGFAASITALRRRLPKITIEILIPDFRGSREAIERVVSAGPDVLNHNLETVPRLYRRVRPGSSYRRSLDLLEAAKSMNPSLLTKTGVMLGLGEHEEEVESVMADAVASGIDIFTAGQYMRPSLDHLPVAEYLSPERFESYKQTAHELGFRHVYIGPLVRSSYHAEAAVLLNAGEGHAVAIAP